MRTEYKRAITATICVATAAINGAIAFEHNNEAVAAQATAQILEAQGYPEAAEWQAIADDKEDERNLNLLIGGLSLGAAASFGAAGVSIAKSRRRENLG